MMKYLYRLYQLFICLPLLLVATIITARGMPPWQRTFLGLLSWEMLGMAMDKTSAPTHKS